jgi:hypothetical protein
MAESFVECDQSHVDVQLVIPELIKLIGTVCELIFTRITYDEKPDHELNKQWF